MKASSNFAWPVAAVFGLTALLGASSAFAADVIGEEPPAPAAPVELAPVSTWAGPYAGVSAGYGFSGKTDLPGVEIGTDGFIGGAFAGIQGQGGRVVYGVEGDVNYNGMDGTEAGVEAKSRVDGSLRARLGYAATDNIMPYVTAGGAAKGQRLSAGGVEDSNTHIGWTAGAGVDTKLTENVFARGEYRYTDYGSETYNLGAGDFDADSKDHRVTVGLGIKF